MTKPVTPSLGSRDIGRDNANPAPIYAPVSAAVPTLAPAPTPERERDKEDSVTIRSRLRSLIGKKSSQSALRETLELIEDGEESETSMSPEQLAFLRNIIDLGEVNIYDIMVPRAKIVAVDRSLSFSELIGAMARAQHSRLPVFDESLDNSLGMVHIRDVLTAMHQGKTPTVDEIMREVIFVSPSSRPLALLAEMRSKRIHLAMVADEYGGIDGLVTIEDIVEQIVGDINDEHDAEDQPMLHRNPDGSVVTDGTVSIEDVEALTNKSLLPDEDQAEIETIGGLITSLIGRVPGSGERIEHPSGLVFEVLSATPRRIEKVKIHLTPPTNPEA
ncbi:MAG: hemolysin family protein [Candidatus Pacebacteria bacterium]|nr:hemolysin family protein [Candidatus Paceibacterota bacterium]